MSTRNLRSSRRNPISSDNLAVNATTTTTTISQNTIPIVSTSAVTPLMSIRFPVGLGPQTNSSPDTDLSITTPTYSSLTARVISGQEGDTVKRNVNMSQPNRSSQPEQNADRIEGDQTIRDYVSASVQAAQESIRREVQNMQLMLPQLIRESLRSERLNSFENPDGHDCRNFAIDNHFQTPFNNFGRQPHFPSHNPNFIPQRGPPNIPQPVFNNSTDDSRQYPGLDSSCSINRTASPSQLEKWGIKYDGTNKTLTVEDFVFRVEALRQDYNCSWEVLMKGFHHLVTGAASTWFWSFRMKYPICNWQTFKHFMVKKFRNFESDFEIQRKIMERRQAPTESADAFISDIVKLKNQMRVHIAENELVKMVKDNLKDGLAQLIFPIRIDNLDHLLEECKRAERNISKRSSNRMSVGNRKVYEVDFFDTETDNEQRQLVEALQREKFSGNQLICWNCKVPGHSFIECAVAQRKLFCFKCGFEDVTSPTCPRCTGNQHQNMRKAGTACSKQNDTQ